MLNTTTNSYVQNWPDFVRIALTEESYTSQVVFAVALFIIFIASLIGNVLTCIVIYYDKTMHTATNYYLFNLAVSDLLVTFPILLIIYQLLTQESELVQIKHGVMSCKFFLCIQFIIVTILWNNGILVMTALAIERYIAICYPMVLKGTPAATWRRVGKIIGGIWTIAIMETLPELWLLDVIETDKSLICFSAITPFTRVMNGTLAVITFIVPLSIMIFVYSMIAFVVNDNQKNNMKDVVYNVCAKRKKVNKLIVALTVSFVFCWLPFFLIRIVVFANDVQKFAHLHRWWPAAHKVAMFHSWFTTVLNPLLFSVMSTKFRQALQMLWNSKFKKLNFKVENNVTLRAHTKKLEIRNLKVQL